MMVHGLDRRFAFRVLSARGVAQSTYRTIIAFGTIAVLLSAFISNTAATAMIFPIGLGVMGALSGLIDKQSEGQTNPERLSRDVLDSSGCGGYRGGGYVLYLRDSARPAR